MTEVVSHAKCALFSDWQRKYLAPKFEDDIHGDWIMWELPRKGHRYVISLDPAEGKPKVKGVRTSMDYTSMDVLRYTHEVNEKSAHVQVAQMRAQHVEPRNAARQAVAAAKLYNNALIVIERNNSGIAAIEEAKDAGADLYCRIIYGKYGQELSREAGFLTTTGTGEAQGAKVVVVTQLNSVWQQGYLVLNSLSTVTEFGTYAQDDNGRFRAIGQNNDDTVSSAFLAVEGVKYITGQIYPIALRDADWLRKQVQDDGEAYEPPPKIVKPRRSEDGKPSEEWSNYVL